MPELCSHHQPNQDHANTITGPLTKSLQSNLSKQNVNNVEKSDSEDADNEGQPKDKPSNRSKRLCSAGDKPVQTIPSMSGAFTSFITTHHFDVFTGNSNVSHTSLILPRVVINTITNFYFITYYFVQAMALLKTLTKSTIPQPMDNMTENECDGGEGEGDNETETTTLCPDNVNKDGLFDDVHVQPIKSLRSNIGHITCDNPANMNTMLVEFVQWVKSHTDKTWIEKKRHIHIRCLAHVIHLTMRVLISAYRKAPFYNPEKAELDIPFENGCHDEIGLV
ncbi:hypothetical protein BS17DRAFT_766778 [Gyrodon lividus]|nr:hypothetical protein BS17DRAFT_766778 [Gyrodon lividus]